MSDPQRDQPDPPRASTGGEAEPEFDAGFDAVFSRIQEIGGWLTRDQARRLYDETRALPPHATVVEVGAHQGRSTLSMALARPDVEVVAVDPFVAGGKFGGPATRTVFEDNARRLDAGDRVRLIPMRSREARREWRGPVHLLFVDGKHDVLSTLSDLRWARFLPPGGRVLVHDAFSSVGVTLACLTLLRPRAALRYLGRVGSLATFERNPMTGSARRRMLRELPWWLRNVGLKVLLRARLRAVARLLGHHDAADPY